MMTKQGKEVPICFGNFEGKPKCYKKCLERKACVDKTAE
jgi:hypothetical protein